MGYRQYTSCVNPGNYIDLSFNAIGIRNILILLTTDAVLTWVGAVILGGPAGIIAAILTMTTVVAYLYWWLHGRLICLGGERCAIGVVEGAGPSDPLAKFGDNDYTMNIFLAPGPTDYDLSNPCLFWPPQACNSNQGNQQQGELVQPNPAILAIGRGYAQDADKKYQEHLHCEFEGNGVYTMLLYAELVLALLVAALIATLLASSLGPIFILFAIFFFLVGLLTKVLIGPGAAGAGDPGDLNPSPGELAVGDIVVVKGDWIYDSLHPGWNEIHAIHACQKCSPETINLGDPWPTDFTGAQLDAMLQKWCSALAGAQGAETGGSRQDPQNGWVIHPLVDGCTPVVLF